MGGSGPKKKDLTSLEASRSAKDSAPQHSFKSIFSAPTTEQSRKLAPIFVPPEAFGGSMSWDEQDDAVELASASSWDIATRYHEFKARPSLQKIARQLRKLSADAILERARHVLGSVVHPVVQKTVPWSELPAEASSPELDLDETMDNAPLALASAAAGGASSRKFPLTGQDLWMTYDTHRPQPVILSVDTSLSMTGEKLALTAVALAVVLLQFPEDPVGIVAFENTATVLKRPDERLTVAQLVERFLDVPAQGYTHLEDGMKSALKLVRSASGGGHGRPASTVLLSDGKYTAGRDPSYLAPKFPHLVMIKMGRERASLELCRELAQKGSGTLKEVGELEALPSVMYSVVKDLLRGRSLA